MVVEKEKGKLSSSLAAVNEENEALRASLQEKLALVSALEVMSENQAPSEVIDKLEAERDELLELLKEKQTEIDAAERNRMELETKVHGTPEFAPIVKRMITIIV